MDNLEQLNISENSPEQAERVEISQKTASQAFPVKDDDKGKEIKEIKKEIKEIGGEEQSADVSRKQIPDINSLEDLLLIKEGGVKLQALLKLANKGEKEEEKALEMAKEIWEDTENAVLLDELRDKLAE